MQNEGVLSLAELRRAVRSLDRIIAGGRLQRVVQPDEHSVALSIYGVGEETHALLCCRPGFARLSILPFAPPAPSTPPAFAQYLRAHLRGARCVGARLLGEDRLAALRFEGAGGGHDLVLSILGPRSNIYLLDGEQRLVACLRPLAETRRDLALGEPWTSPPSAAPREGEDRWAGVADADLLAAIESTYAEIEGSHERDDLARQIGTAFRKELQFLEKREAKIAADLAAARAATGARRQGELLKGALRQVQPGAERVVAQDYETGEEVVIRLDPALSPGENMTRLFSRYQKAQKGVRVLEQQLAGVSRRRDEVAPLAEECERLGLAATLSELRSFAERREVRAVLGRQARGAATKGPRAVTAAPVSETARAHAKLPARLRPKVYRTEDGLEIWVGRTDEGNDYLTTKLARGNDLFFHLDGEAGSHVILRTGGRKDPPPESILDACELAVHFSKARDAGRADVHVAAIKDVKKPARAKPGLVHVLRGKTIHLRREPDRLTRLLAK